jgi:hypothetical protein
MGPTNEPACPVNRDIGPVRLGTIDIAALDDREVRASLLNLAGHSDPVVAEATVEAVRRVLQRTRIEGRPPLDP